MMNVERRKVSQHFHQLFCFENFRFYGVNMNFHEVQSPRKFVMRKIKSNFTGNTINNKHTQSKYSINSITNGSPPTVVLMYSKMKLTHVARPYILLLRDNLIKV